MATTLISGPRTWGLTRDEEGHRTYTVTHFVADDSTGTLAGPLAILETVGLPQIGDAWNFGTDLDIWAFCYPTADVTIEQEEEGERPVLYRIDQVFSTKPLNRCQDDSIEDPLLEPDKISGSFVKYTKEITRDKDGKPILNSAHELVRGPQVECDFNRPTVIIEQNVAVLELDLFSSMIDTLNDATLWGLGPRKIKLSNAPWSRRYFGTCTIYYTRTFEFDVDFNTFDRQALDEGTKVLRGQWVNSGTEDDPDWDWALIGNPDPTNPTHFIQYRDIHGELGRVILNGVGLPVGVTITETGTGTFSSTDPGSIDVKCYPESDFLLLGVPINL